MRRSTIIGAVLACGLALAGCTPSEEDSDQPPAPATPPPAAAQQQPANYDRAEDGAGGGAEDGAEDGVGSGAEDGVEDGAAEGASAEHSSTDREFAEELLGNREQLLELSDTAGRNAGANAIRSLGHELHNIAQPQADQLTGWLAATEGQESGSDPQDQDTSDGPQGRLDGARFQELTALNGAQFDEGFRQAVTELSENAEQLATLQLEEGSAEEMRGLAEQVVAEHEQVLAQVDALP